MINIRRDQYTNKLLDDVQPLFAARESRISPYKYKQLNKLSMDLSTFEKFVTVRHIVSIKAKKLQVQLIIQATI